jgi:sec-independent protein translocase protein TatC
MGNFFLRLWRFFTAPFRFIRWIIKSIYRNVTMLGRNAFQLLTEEIEDEPLPDTFAKTIENPLGLFEHINELRKHLFRALLFFLITTTFSFIFTPRIIDIMAKPVGGLHGLRAIDITEPISVFMRVALLCGFALALPYIIFELWLFAAPGLKRKSRLISLIGIPISLFFFIGGIAFAYFVLLPVAVPYLTNFMGMTTDVRPSSYIGFVTNILFWIGISFEFPLVIYVLALAHLVNAKVLLGQWRLAVVLISILAAVITPTVDPINMSIVMGPMIILYFFSIGLAYIARHGDETTN